MFALSNDVDPSLYADPDHVSFLNADQDLNLNFRRGKSEFFVKNLH